MATESLSHKITTWPLVFLLIRFPPLRHSFPLSPPPMDTPSPQCLVLIQCNYSISWLKFNLQVSAKLFPDSLHFNLRHLWSTWFFFISIKMEFIVHDLYKHWQCDTKRKYQLYVYVRPYKGFIDLDQHTTHVKSRRCHMFRHAKGKIALFLQCHLCH